MPRENLNFDAVREIGLALPDVEDSTTYRGFSLKVRGRLLACAAIHKSAEPDSLMVRIGFEECALLRAAEPDTYYLTEHYSRHPTVLVRLEQISRDSLRDLLGRAWLFVSEKAREGRPKARRQAGSSAVREKRRKPTDVRR
jgi:hypothetical protein